MGLPTDRGFALGLALSVLEALAAIALLGCSAWLISAAAEQPPIMYLNMAIVGVRGFALGRAFFRYTQRLTLHDSAFKLQTKLRPSLFAAVAPMAPAGLGSISRGGIGVQLVNDVEEIQNLGVRVIAPLVQAAFASLLTVVGLASVAPGSGAWKSLVEALVLSTLIALPLTALWNRRQVTAALSARNKLQTETQQLIENLDLLIAYEWDQDSISKVGKLDVSLSRSSRRFALTAGVSASVFTFFSTLAVTAAAYSGGVAVQLGTMDHRLLAVVALVPLAVFELVSQLPAATTAFQKYLASAKKVLASLDSKPAESIEPSTGSTQLDVITDMRLRDAILRYPGSGDSVGPLNLELRAGESLVVRGPSGSGKSTLAYAVAGFLHSDSGSVQINGRALSEFNEDSLRRCIGYLEQSPTIFDTTVKANLLIAKQQASDDELWLALDRVGLKTLFKTRDGLDTQLGDRGAAISGGEAQRIALARALLAGFQVLIFDEPTANLDDQAATKLWEDLKAITVADPNRISIFITHDRNLTVTGLKSLDL